jgi:hypothetical protein
MCDLLADMLIVVAAGNQASCLGYFNNLFSTLLLSLVGYSEFERFASVTNPQVCAEMLAGQEVRQGVWQGMPVRGGAL